MTCPVLTACFVAALSIVDGDTIHSPWPGPNLRLVGALTPFDTPETHQAECPEERAHGERATARLTALVADGAYVTLTGRECGYGRPCAVLTLLGGRDVGNVLVAEGLALPVKNADWCTALRRSP